jgi:uncharacterized protein
MLLHQERPDYTWTLRGADGAHVLVNERSLTHSCVVSPESLVEDWAVTDATSMAPTDLEPLLALNPELVLLGTGERQVFPAAAVLAACLGRGIGLEVMSNDAAARTYSVLAGEGRRVVAGFLLPAPTGSASD